MSLLEAAQNAHTAFSEIPIVDLKDINDPDPRVQQALAKQIRDACIDVGFFYAIIAATLESMKTYFALPLETKMELNHTKTPNFKGYNAVMSSNNDPNGAGDMHEGFECTRCPPRNDGSMAGANVWPDVPGFRVSLLRYYHGAVGLGKDLFPLFARALDLAPCFFDDKTRNSAALMRVLHYPPQMGPIDERVIGIGAHTERYMQSIYETAGFQCFTILWQQPGIQALQVCNTRGEWIDAPSIPGTLVIKCFGDQFARWTNDVFKSTVHRAANRSGERRYSIPLFFGTDYDVLLEPIASCVSPERPPRYEVVTAGDYVKMRLQATYGH
ncbi:Clavaminate synthase-like protein [Lactifluus subvellereus]|nr:Clavaminate synthase-like protein [Lactifluus subvellereus]